MRLIGEVAVAVAGASQTRPLASFSRQRVHAVAAIGNPGAVLRRPAGARHRGRSPHPFPDHHAFIAADLEFGDDLPVLMTEKDAIKCVALRRSPMSGAYRSAPNLPQTFIDALIARLRTR